MTTVMDWLFGEQARPDGREPLQQDRRPDNAATAAAPDGGQAAASSGRRERALDDGSRQLRDGLAQKVLHSWLQNRHQTLYPLTVNLHSLSEENRAALANWMAVAMLAGRAPDESAIDEARKWLVGVGADAPTLGIFASALNQPPPLSQSLASILTNTLGPYAYVMALMALHPADPATSPFLDYLAIRLNLPTTVVRSATRRYRR